VVEYVEGFFIKQTDISVWYFISWVIFAKKNFWFKSNWHVPATLTPPLVISENYIFKSTNNENLKLDGDCLSSLRSQKFDVCFISHPLPTSFIFPNGFDFNISKRGLQKVFKVYHFFGLT